MVKEPIHKDWRGDSNSIWKTLGASNHTEKERQQDDYYATDPIAVNKLLNVEKPYERIWECACGEGHLSKRLSDLGYEVISSDIVDRGYPGTKVIDFLTAPPLREPCDILTNPPYAHAKEFVEKALKLVRPGRKVYMFLKLTFLEGKARYRDLFSKYPPKRILVFSERILCAKNGDFQRMKDGGGSAVAYAWFVWEKGYEGTTEIKWI